MNKIDISNFKIIDIVERSNDVISNDVMSNCCFCDKRINRISVFDRCLHNSCLDCVDSLYDLYKKIDNNNNKDNNILFLCPLCNEKVYDITYKDL